MGSGGFRFALPTLRILFLWRDAGVSPALGRFLEWGGGDGCEKAGMVPTASNLVSNLKSGSGKQVPVTMVFLLFPRIFK